MNPFDTLLNWRLTMTMTLTEIFAGIGLLGAIIGSYYVTVNRISALDNKLQSEVQRLEATRETKFQHLNDVKADKDSIYRTIQENQTVILNELRELSTNITKVVAVVGELDCKKNKACPTI
jgi:hypothetical protein